MTKTSPATRRAGGTSVEIVDDAEPFQASWEALLNYRDRLVSREYGEQPFDRRNAGFHYIKSDYLLATGVVASLKALFAYLQSIPFEHPDLS
jgi:hypothetical protein